MAERLTNPYTPFSQRLEKIYNKLDREIRADQERRERVRPEWNELADKARFGALLMFENEQKFTIDLYEGNIEIGEPVATLEMALDHPEAAGGKFTLLCDWPAKP